MMASALLAVFLLGLGMVSALASGRYVPRLDTALKLCRALGVDNPCALFDDNGRPRP